MQMIKFIVGAKAFIAFHLCTHLSSLGLMLLSVCLPLHTLSISTHFVCHIRDRYKDEMAIIYKEHDHEMYVYAQQSSC